MGNLFAGLTEWAVNLIERLGYLGIALIIALENVFPPIPSEAVLPMAGFLAGQGRFNIFGVILAATAGSVGGALVLYYLGEWLGNCRLHELIRKFGGWLMFEEEDLDKGQEWFEKHGAKAVLFGRLIPMIRSVISIPAGLSRMPVGTFVIYTAIGSAVWNSLLISVGWLLGDNWESVQQYTGILNYVGPALIIAAVVWLVARRLTHRRSKEQTGAR